MKKILSTLLLGSVFASAIAATPQEKVMLEKLNKEYPKLNVEDAVFLPQINLYELHLKNNTALAYTNENINYMLMNGEIVDPSKQVNISVQREAINVNRVFNGLPINKAIVIKYGKGTRKIALFTDPDCPFCKTTDQDIHKGMTNEDVTFYYYMNPLKIEGHEEAPLKARKIWCSPDKGKAWVNWMMTGTLPNNAGTCANPVDDTKKLSTSLGFLSTPIMIFDNGYVWRGQMTTEQMKAMLKKAPALKVTR